MSLLEATYQVSVIPVGPPVSHLAGDGSPEIHSPWNCRGRVSVSCRKGMLGQSSDKGRYIVSRILYQFRLMDIAARKQADRQNNQ